MSPPRDIRCRRIEKRIPVDPRRRSATVSVVAGTTPPRVGTAGLPVVSRGLAGREAPLQLARSRATKSLERQRETTHLAIPFTPDVEARPRPSRSTVADGIHVGRGPAERPAIPARRECVSEVTVPLVGASSRVRRGYSAPHGKRGQRLPLESSERLVVVRRSVRVTRALSDLDGAPPVACR